MTPDEVFRFVNVRPVQQAPKDREDKRFTSYGRDDQRSPLHLKIAALPAEGAREAAIALARERLVADDDLDAVGRLVEAVVEASSQSTASKAREAVKKELGQTPADFLKSRAGRELKDVLWDRLYAHTLVPEEGPEDREEVLGGLRALHFLEYLGGQDANEPPLSPEALREVRPTIPPEVVPAAAADGQKWRDEYIDAVKERLRKVHGDVVAVEGALQDLQSTDRVHRTELAQTVLVMAAVAPPRPRAILLAEPAELPSGGHEQPKGEARLDADPSIGPTEERVIVVPKPMPWVFDDFGQRNLSAATKEVLTARRDVLKGLEFAQVVAALEAERHAVVEGFLTGLPRGVLQQVRAEPEFQALMKRVAVPGLDIQTLDPELLPEPGSAAARGIQPLGVGDLLVVRQDVKSYQEGELAHVENVLASETKKRTHSRLRETEEIQVTETERTEESEKDLQTTERFELQKEAQKTVESQMSLEAGLAVSASYGPVSVTAHADFALSQSSSESSRTASTFAKQITERSVARIKERTRIERTRRTLERFEETNEHGFTNSGPGAEHVIGVYRWIDKHYRARLINYGRRMMFEFLIPEPAAFYLAVQAAQPLKGITLQKPTEPMVWGRRLEPGDLSKWNYRSYIASYNVQDVEAYPDEVVSVSAAFAEAAQGDKNVEYAKTSEKLVVPDGYESESVYGMLGWMGKTGTSYFAECFVGGRNWPNVSSAGLQGPIPVSVKGWFTGFHVNLVAVCRIKPETIAKWQVKTYEAIMNAYERALADYNEQVAAAQIQAGVNIQGRNPEVNRRIEKDELRKGVLRLLTDDFARTRVSGAWRFDERFDAMQQNGPYGYPDFDTAEATVEGRIIQFFEQAFEWTNMTYRFYPYFWGRRDRWNQTFPLSDPDPMFVDFLRAGSARMIVPVQPSYDDTVLHYLATNEIWNGGTPPTLNDPLYRSLIDDLKADAGTDLDQATACEPGGTTYPCLVDEWELKLPTDLVYLQKDATLPQL